MNKTLIFITISILVVVCCSGIASTSSIENEEQLLFNKALDEFLSKRAAVPASKPANRRSMRRSTETSRLINDIFNFQQEYNANLVKEGRSKRGTPVGYTVSSQYCPFQNITCNTSYIYRSFDGSCNNLANPQYGQSNTPYSRFLTPAYADGVSTPRQLAVSGAALPNPRTISLTVSPPLFGSDQLTTNTISHLYTIFGQFLTHNIGGVSTTTDSNGNDIDCPCTSTDTNNCMGITVPSGDTYLGQQCYNTRQGCSSGTVSTQTCINFTRSSGTYPTLSCTGTYKENLNLLSSWIDGAAIYGFDSTRNSLLRTFSGGLLKTSSGLAGVASQGTTTRTYLPLASDYTCNACYTTNSCTSTTSLYSCFLAGEWRVSENLALTSVQTLFNREHNRIAAQLASLNPTWNDETLYQEARKIVIGELQHIVYNEYVPLINGSTSLSPLSTTSYYTGYNSAVNPALTNEFITAAFRMGHSMVLQQLRQYNVSNVYYGQQSNFMFGSIVFQSDYAYSSTYNGLNSIFVGLLNMNSWLFGTFGNQLQNNLFQMTYPNGTTTASDLLAINIQRGRDHGLQPYYKYVQACTGKTITSFGNLSTLISSTKLATLQTLYSSVYDIDLYVGGLAESVSANSNIATGPTFSCIIMSQFQSLKNGDRFYYENGPSTSSTAFTLSQLASIKNVTMAGLICNNFDLYSVQPKAFLNPTVSGNTAVSCSSLMSQLNLTNWKDIL